MRRSLAKVGVERTWATDSEVDRVGAFFTALSQVTNVVPVHGFSVFLAPATGTRSPFAALTLNLVVSQLP